MPKQKKKTQLTCPCCKQPQRKADVRAALKAVTEVSGIIVRVATANDADDKTTWLASFDRWACDECLRSGRAIAANPKLQRREHPMAHDPEYLAFWDKPQPACQDCGQPFVFSKTEQLFYYQTLGHSRLARPVRCLACRQARREAHRPARELGEMLENGELRKEEFRDRVIANYRLLGREDKARYFEKRRPEG